MTGTPKPASVTTDTCTGEALRVADTSFLYALFSESDAFHARALAAAAVPEATLVPAEIFSETLSLVQYRQGHEAARAAGEWIRNQGRIEIGVSTRAQLGKAWETFASARGRLSYPDAVVLAWCEGRDVSPLAFDEGLLRAWRGRRTSHRQPS